MMRCYLFDIDGTCANIDHRLHHIRRDPVLSDKPNGIAIIPRPSPADWDAFYDACPGDMPISAVCHLAHSLMLREMVIFTTGRTERIRAKTMTWLGAHLAPPALLAQRSKLYMRADGDHRADHIIKGEMLTQIRLDGFEPIMAFEDRASVVKMWRAAGLVCAQMADGDF